MSKKKEKVDNETADRPFADLLNTVIDQEVQRQRYAAVDMFVQDHLFTVGAKNANTTPAWQFKDFAHIVWEGNHDDISAGFQLDYDQSGTVVGELLTLLTGKSFFEESTIVPITKTASESESESESETPTIAETSVITDTILDYQ